jgi:hypothetical protein
LAAPLSPPSLRHCRTRSHHYRLRPGMPWSPVREAMTFAAVTRLSDRQVTAVYR